MSTHPTSVNRKRKCYYLASIFLEIENMINDQYQGYDNKQDTFVLLVSSQWLASVNIAAEKHLPKSLYQKSSFLTFPRAKSYKAL